MYDIDNFKNINDTYGRLVGDSILSEFTNILKN
ncbi:diguanylate cyclase [Pseudoalteromonas fuliginea]